MGVSRALWVGPFGSIRVGPLGPIGPARLARPCADVMQGSLKDP